MEAFGKQVAAEVLLGRVALLQPWTNSAGFTYAPGSLGTALASQGGETVRARFADDCACELSRESLAIVRADSTLPSARECSILFASIVGSRSHGLESEESDFDRRGFYIAGAAMQFSLDGAPAQLVNDRDQLCFWEVEKFLRLALKANPTVLECLYSPIVEIASPAICGQLEHFKKRGVFLSRRAHQTFMGYADSQFEKMARAYEQHGIVKWQHAMHLIRLLRVGIRLVRTGTLSVVVPADEREELLAIKRGERNWDEVSALRSALAEQFQQAAKHSVLPAEPKEEEVNQFLVDLRLAAVKAGRI